MFEPLNHTSPAEASRSPVKIETVVDFPEPLGPSSPTIAPGATLKLTSRIAATAE